MTADASLPHRDVVIRYERLLPIVYYFPKGTGFAVRDGIFTERPFDVSVLRTARSMIVFPGKIPPSVLNRPVLIVGWIEGPHPSGSWPDQVMQCVGIIPVTKEGGLDYKRAALVMPQSNGIL